ncbi:uncharacterized protein [Rutidosis leptorrhynchoides]|uniref:uncharacterized protein n=1 Tax=Rutidosis leptorrhynchoides TaxID=125765 RepID=UPI003A993DF6
MTDQVVHCLVQSMNNDCKFFISFVYAGNHYAHRQILWKDLLLHKSFVGNRPWSLMGDFNAAINTDDYASRSSNITLAMREFKECMDELLIEDVNHSGFRFTWNQKPHATSGLLKKLDRVMANDAFINSFVNAYVIFQPYRISDHCPAILKIDKGGAKKPRPFKFGNFIVHHPVFISSVAEGWDVEMEGHHMFRVVKRLRLLKYSMQKLMWSKGNLHDRVLLLRKELDAA